MNPGFVRAEGGRLVDGSGAAVHLRGVGLGNWLLPEGYMWRFDQTAPQSPRRIEAFVRDLVGDERADEFWRQFRDRFVTRRDIALMREMGFDHVRLPINSRLVIADDGTLLDDGLALIDRTIDWCRDESMWVVLDLHGAPGGQTGTNIDDSPNEVPELFDSPHWWGLTVRLWTALARRYRDEPVVAGYDLLNEPLPNEYQHRYADDLVALYRELTAAIREVDPKHLLIYEGMHWANNWTIFTERWDDNSMLQFHKYWSPPDRPSIQRFIDIGAELGLPIYMGEGGENNPDWIHTAFRLFDDLEIPWNFWPWKKIDTRTSPCSIVPPPGWDAIRAYAAGTGPRPLAADAAATLDELLENMDVDRCERREDVIAALFRRAPLRLPASGFGFRGAGVSYATTTAEPLAGFRADDRVTLRPVAGAAPEVRFDHNDGRERSPDEAVILGLAPGDWVAYPFEVAEAREYEIEIALAAGAHPLITVDGQRATTTTGATRIELAVGAHELRLVGADAEVAVRHVDIH